MGGLIHDLDMVFVFVKLLLDPPNFTITSNFSTLYFRWNYSRYKFTISGKVFAGVPAKNFVARS